ncbi:MAG: glycosyltransferase family 4 protein [Thiothrix sp.]|uniref:glycosyltransferase family 4 protein n=1 Tax=Thiothrix sp. TaxID=1032 RepID=UPI0026109255|nr:glycosyltransferase family 4 protein [Thiothrix sp.]MDD5392929.1 glycosyltransferase family 4 protein [Thiothrix sp.]
MNLFVIGARSFPGVQGGIEKHCEEVYPLLANNINITVLTSRQPKYKKWNNIRFIKMPALKGIKFEKITYAISSLIYIFFSRPDAVHIQGLNSALIIPLIRISSIKVIYTQHSMDYLYPKWGRIAKAVLLLSEYCGSKANLITVVSPLIQKRILIKYNKNSIISYNGVSMAGNKRAIAKENLFDHFLKKKFLLFVGRITPEKDLLTLIDAFKHVSAIDEDLHLVIVGNINDDNGPYIELIKVSIKNLHGKVILSGEIDNSYLPIIYSSSRLFILPSKFEAFGVVVLEAIYNQCQVLLSDIDALRQFDFLPDKCFFKTGTVDDLAEKILNLVNQPLSSDKLINFKQIIESRYSWSQTASIYDGIYKGDLPVKPR